MQLDKQEILKRANDYIACEKNDVFKNEVETALKNDNYEDLYDRFYTTLSFGTAGMRGVIGGGTNRMNTFMVKKVSQGLASYLVSSINSPSIVIAYDSRNYSSEFAKAAALVLAANKVKVYLYDSLRPVPMLSFALRELKASAGIVITASHNPSKYNGYKVYWSDGGQVTPPHDIEIAKKANSVVLEDINEIGEDVARESGYLNSVNSEVDEAYYNMVISSIRRKNLVKNSKITVAYTPLHGSGNIPVRSMLDRLGINTVVVKEQELPDGNFPTVKLPNPESPQAMEKVIELAKKEKADIVLGTDPDADRLGIAIPKNKEKSEYQLLSGNQIATLLCDYLLETSKEMNKSGIPFVAKSLVTTDLVKKITESYGGESKDVLTGFKYIAEQIQLLENNKEKYFLFGCEESYGFLSVPGVRDKDAVSSAVLAVEVMCYLESKGLTLQDRLESIYEKYGYSTEIVFARDYEGASGKAEMDKIMQSFHSLKVGDTLVNRKISSIDDLLEEGTGFPKSNVVIIKFESGEKLIVRPSGTEPKIKYYIFLSGEKETLLKEMDSIINEFKTSL
ncbi:MAG: phospho-sugar mutase [Sphaerochaetaceae bacterium]|nr:phospho-sugar mutase [Sphaerochaetaceae bacterium]